MPNKRSNNIIECTLTAVIFSSIAYIRTFAVGLTAHNQMKRQEKLTTMPS
jgi:hypothetical protein